MKTLNLKIVSTLLGTRDIPGSEKELKILCTRITELVQLNGEKWVEENRQKQVVGLIRTNFLKRFESSVAAFEMSCDRLLKKLLAFIEVHSETDPEKKRLERWKMQNAQVVGYATQRQQELWGDGGDDENGRSLPDPLLMQGRLGKWQAAVSTGMALQIVVARTIAVDACLQSLYATDH